MKSKTSVSERVLSCEPQAAEYAELYQAQQPERDPFV